MSKELEANATLSHYRILSKIGAVGLFTLTSSQFLIQSDRIRDLESW